MRLPTLALLWAQKALIVVFVCVSTVVVMWGVRLVVFRESHNAARCPRCNVVILDIDILRADELTCQGKSLRITPNLCRLILSGTRFTNVFSQSFWTLPSELSIVTSLYPNINQVWSQVEGAIPQTSQTLARVLKESGYLTDYQGLNNDATLTVRNGGLQGFTNINLAGAWPGNWLAKYKAQDFTLQPLFFHFYTPLLHMPYTLNDYQKPLENLPKPSGFPVYVKEFDKVQAEYLATHVADIFTPKTIAENPTIFLADPSVRTKKIFDYYQLLDHQNDYVKRITAWPATYAPYMNFIDPNKPQDVAFLHMLYETKLYYTDMYLRPLVDYLMRPDVASRTIVVVMSAHGEAFGEHGIFEHKASPYNAVFHVPLAIKYPKGRAQRIDAVVETMDIYPTLVDMVLGVVPSHLQGQSLVPLLSGISVKPKLYAASIVDEYTFVIQSKRYALIKYRYNKKAPELYDLKNDPKEIHNIASKYPQIVSRMTQLLTQDVAPELQLPGGYITIPNETNQKDLIKDGYF